MTREFVPVGVAVLTVSDTRTIENDTSGGYLASAIEQAGHRLVGRVICPDDVEGGRL